MSNTASHQRIAFIFPGQGSQSLGMLADIAEAYPIIEQTFNEASKALSIDLWKITQSNPELLNQTEYTQPALLAASVAIWRVLKEKTNFTDQQITVVAGHSLGEYSALVATDSIAFTDAIQLVHLRGQLMQQAVQSGTGSMAAILGLSDDEVIDACSNIASISGQVVSAANFNAPKQVVIAGETSAIDQAIERCKTLGAKAVTLPVSVPSHCLLMLPAAEKFAPALNSLELSYPVIPIIQNSTAQKATSVEVMKTNLTEQLYKSVRWTQTMQTMQDMGVTTLIECGAGQVLTGLNKRMGLDFTAHATDTLVKLEAAIELLNIAKPV